MNRILTFHDPEKQSDGRFGAAYYVESDFAPIAVRLHAENAPHLADAEFEILKDGVSIMNNRDKLQRDIYGAITSNTTTTTVVLTKGTSTAEVADDFIDQTIESDGWITCELVNPGGGKNFTVQVELEQIEPEYINEG